MSDGRKFRFRLGEIMKEEAHRWKDCKRCSGGHCECEHALSKKEGWNPDGTIFRGDKLEECLHSIKKGSDGYEYFEWCSCKKFAARVLKANTPSL